ncbi:MAG: hypothetical protein HRU70_05920 [Phycisphaeraceae bacterium]|nr:MAG: hypothetical protein HRU70_05920 [Phycisphaeraceae bacterium]
MLRIGMVGMVAAASCTVAQPGGGSGSGGGDEGPWDRISAAGALAGTLPAEGVAHGFVDSNGRLWYVADDGEPEAVDVGGVKVMYAAPVWWGPDGSATLFSDDPAASPTGAPVSVSVASSAVVMEVVGPWYQGYVVGLLIDSSFESGGLSGGVEAFDGWALAADLTHGKELAEMLGSGDESPGVPAMSYDPSMDACVQACLQQYRDDLDAARDWYAHSLAAYCGWRTMIGIGVTGCVGTLRAKVCKARGLWVPALCCVVGGATSGLTVVHGCAYTYHTLYSNMLRDAHRRFRRCLESCGVILFEV